MDSLTGSLERDNIPLIQDVLKCCSSLVVRDENDQVLLAHHSVRQFLRDYPDLTPKSLQSYDTLVWEKTISGPVRHKIRELELARLCSLHLSSPEYGHAMAPPSQAKSAIDVSLVPDAVLTNFNLGFGKWGFEGLQKSQNLCS